MKCTTLNQPIKLYEEFSDRYRSKAQQLCEHLIEDTNNFHYSSNQPIELMQINDELVIHFKDDLSRYIHLCKKPIGRISGFYINSEKTIAALLTQMPKTDFYTISLYELKKQSIFF